MPSFNTLLASTLPLAASLLMLAEGPRSVQAHIRMSNPPPLRGENNPQYDYTGFDYSMTNPLLEDGSNFACKGYQSDVPGRSHAVETIKAGQQYTVTLEGSATHGGGSCQFSLSYDGGKNFAVVHSVIGGCPLAKSYSFKFPENLPAGKDVLLAWTWFNKVGNREMYMNCAAIDIQSSPTAPLTLPAVFRANTFGPSCHTVEGDELVFPNAGKSISYGGMWEGKKPGRDALKITGCSEDQLKDKFVTLQSNTGGSSPADPQPQPSSSDEPVEQPAPTKDTPVVFPPVSTTTTTSKASLAPIRGNPKPTATSKVASNSATSTTKLSSSRGNTKTSSAPVVIETPAKGDSSPGDFCTGTGLKCSEDGASFYVCSSGSWVSMGLVAPGTECRNGQIGFASIKAPEPCTAGTLKCSKDGNSFSLCNTDGKSYTDMGLVAPGTTCQGGKIRAASSSTKRGKRHGPRRLAHTS